MKTKIIKTFFAALCCFTLLCGITASAANKYPNPTDAFFVNDYAGVLNSTTEQTIYNQGKSLYEQTKAQAAVLVVDSLDGESIEEYSMGVATQWGLGDKQEDNGLLLLIAVEDREIRIEVGYGLEGALPDGKVGLLMEEYAYPPLQDDDYDTAVISLYDALINEIYIEYGIEPDSDYTPASELEDSNSILTYVFILIFIVLLIFGRRGRGHFVFLPFLSHGSHHHRGGGFGGGFGGGGGFRGGGGGFGGGGASGKF